MTTPYVTGTVSVTAGSAIVTGVGTGWLTSGLVAGQFGLDSANGNPVPVLSIDSDTQITLAKPWRGTSASAQGFWITYDTTPGQQTVANAQRLAEYIARLDKPFFSALAGLIPAADKLPYFGPGGAGALADFNAAARALLAGTGTITNAQTPDRIKQQSPYIANLDAFVTNGWGSTDPATVGLPPIGAYYTVFNNAWADPFYCVQTAYSVLSLSQVYRRRKDGATWSAWVPVPGQTLGTVSQSGGVPTGSIIERGSNANGQYVRFADGTQICWKPVTMTGLDNKRLYGAWTFPIVFSAAPNVTSTINLATFISAGWPVSNGSTLNYASVVDLAAASCVISLETNYTGVSTGINVVACQCMAIGRWY